MATRRALGRGLEALLPGGSTGPAAAPAHESRGEVPIAAIGVNPAQPRRVFDQEALEDLTGSIREYGILQPLLVRRSTEGFELIAGERRLRAAAAAGLSMVPVVIRESDERERMELALVENLQREDLTPIEEAGAYRRLMDEFGLTQEEVASRVGKGRSTVANTLRLLGLPEAVKDMVEGGELTAAHARSVLAIDGSEARVRFARDLVERGVPKSGAERLVQARKPGRGSRARGSAGKVKEDPNARSVSDRLTRALGTRVRVTPRRRGGVIEIEYYSNEELDRLLAKIAPGTEAF